MTIHSIVRQAVLVSATAAAASLAVVNHPLIASSSGAGSSELLIINTKTTKCLTIAGGVSTANNVEAGSSTATVTRHAYGC